MKTRVSYPGQSLAEIAVVSDNSASLIVSVLRTMPPTDQEALLADLHPDERRVHRWVSFRTAKVIERLLLDVDPEDVSLIESRLLPPWLRRERRLDDRDEAIRMLVPLYVEPPVPTSGRSLAKVIAAYCRRLPPIGDPRRGLIERVLAKNGGKPPGEATIRRVLTGLPR